ncbi:unnamed protein product [Moneuplotes crassus]|uniref:Cyclin N-terminal domain-containing protein n=2 Tax=Euplotes crassus TaxID=5936 RepID=A0AAD1XSZ2_EUPCR|nr:unnamed protein product [Moneuplotes crassus]
METPGTDDTDDRMRLAQTMNSMSATSTISKPDVESIIQAVATIIHSQMIEDQTAGNEIDEDSELFFFSEEKYIKEKPESFDEKRLELLRETPKVENINEFMKALYDCAQFSPECCIICLVYINRLIAFTNLPLQPTNWRPLILCSLLVAQKVWDDRYLSNDDFAYIYPFFVTKEINKLEQKFLELIQYNVTVKASLYAKYYFELRSLFKDSSGGFPLKELDDKDKQRLELRSEKYQDAFAEATEAKKREINTIADIKYSSKA